MEFCYKREANKRRESSVHKNACLEDEKFLKNTVKEGEWIYL